MSKFFVGDVLNNVDSDAMHLVMNVFNATTSDINPLHSRMLMSHSSCYFQVLLYFSSLVYYHANKVAVA